MKYFLFIDESGDHGLANVDRDFPVFTLCGVVFSEQDYLKFNERTLQLKNKFWGSNGVILHSRDIRKCQKEFAILLDLDLKRQFYQDLNALISESKYTIISSVVKKEEYIKNTGSQAMFTP